MFDRLFAYLREGFKNAFLGALADADEELAAKIEKGEPLTIEAKPIENGKSSNRKKAATSKR